MGASFLAGSAGFGKTGLGGLADFFSGLSRQTLAVATSLSSFCDERRVLTSLKSPQMGHLLVPSTRNHVGIRLEHPDSEQPIEIGWLILGRNTQPFVVGIKRFGHVTLLMYGMLAILRPKGQA